MNVNWMNYSIVNAIARAHTHIQTEKKGEKESEPYPCCFIPYSHFKFNCPYLSHFVCSRIFSQCLHILRVFACAQDGFGIEYKRFYEEIDWNEMTFSHTKTAT